jgi:NAD(P)-dependent dehydrogenase (short-subunit alcohol dehydrogenase family)
MSIQFGFDGSVVLVTGGATGLGRATAEAFGRAGARIALNDVTDERANAACADLKAEGIDCLPFAADVRDGAAVRAMASAITEAFGGIDICVANAGIYPNTPFLEISDEEWDQVIDTNLNGVFHTAQAAARVMVQQGTRGQIITLSSGAAINGLWGWSHYSASKAAIVLLTKTIAIELAPHGIRVNSVLPGYIDVPEGGAHLTEQYKDAARSAIPRGRPGAPADIANGIVLLASPLADFITGTTLAIDGGSTAGKVSLRPSGA